MCYAFSTQFARLATLRFTLIMPSVLGIIYIGAFQGSRNWGDMWTLVIFGVLGWGMKHAPADAGPLLSLLEPFVLLGIGLLIAWTLMRIKLLGLADLSYVLPITAVGYVLNAVMGAGGAEVYTPVQRDIITLLS